MLDPLKNLFYNPAYLEIQAQEHLRIFEDAHFRVFFSLNDEVATSLPRGLFGSFENLSDGTPAEFSLFVKTIMDELIKENIHEVEVIHPPSCYGGFVPSSWLEEVGFYEMYSDINHHIDLTDFQIHPMEQRKLEKLNQSGLVVQELLIEHLPEIYDFLSKCRTEKGLKLNISLEKLVALFKAFPDRYSIFGAYMKDQLVSAVITVQTAADVVYYYLPGTPDKYKQESPMVGLIQFLIDHFKTEIKYLDLGVSSVKGEPQDGLIGFKERMSGFRSEKKTFSLNLDQSHAH